MTKVKTYTAIVVDRSGSMGETEGLRLEAEGGVRMFIDKLAGMTEARNMVSLYEFDTEFSHVFGPVKAEDADEYKLVPRGMTALFDAVGLTIEDTKRVIGSMKFKDKPEKVALVIMTDGRENKSKEHTFDSVQKLVADCKKAGWEIVFLAGTLEARQFAQASGLRTSSFDPQTRGSTYSVYSAAANATAGYYAGETVSINVPDSVTGNETEMTEQERRELAYQHRGEVTGEGEPVAPKDFPIKEDGK